MCDYYKMSQEEIDLGLILKFPLINTISSNNITIYEGYLNANGQDIKVKIIQEACNDTMNYAVELDDKILEEKLSDLNLERCNILQTLLLIQSTLENNVSIIKDYSHIYARVLSEYSEFTRFYLNLRKCVLSPDLRRISLTTLDSGNREHDLEILVDYSDADANIFYVNSYNLPEKRGRVLQRRSHSLTECYDRYLNILENLQPYFDIMKAFDENCCILDPEQPKYSDNHRRIFLGTNICMILKVDPFNIFQRPQLDFLGPERLTNEFRNKLNNNLENWDATSVDIFHEVLKILELDTFPSKPEKENQNNVVLLFEEEDCSICFSSRLNDKLPEIVCNNKSCEYFYHHECLYEWLTSINSKRIANEIHGKCPNCEKNISCPLVM